MKIHVLHENAEWTRPLIQALEDRNLPYEDWFLNEGMLDLTEEPPRGVFYNRMSASSHTRNHRYAVNHTLAVLNWLERHDRPVYNGSGVLHLEVNKVTQYMALNRAGIKTPKTIAVIGKEQIVEAARRFQGPFITKHNRGGKGLGVQLFQHVDALRDYVEGPDFEEPIDGVTLIQQYIQAPEPFITRCEFVGGKFLYAVRVNTSEGFELCPADACQIGDAFCPVGDVQQVSKFQIIEGFDHPIIQKYERFLANEKIHIAGIEMIRNEDGEVFTYDVNTNTNYNAEAESVAGVSGMGAIADYLGQELRKLQPLAVG